MTAPTPTSIERFDRTERNVHWWTAALVGACLLTAAALYLPAVSVLIGRRGLVRDVHVVSGLALPVPYLVARLGRWRTGLRGDVRRLNRWDAMDRRWLASLGRDPFVRSAKFNAGQKLNAAFDVGAIALLLATGSVMRWFGPFPLSWRTGATFVHDWTAFALLLVLIGHVGKGLADRQALRAMVRGDVPVRWAERHAPRWLEEPRP